MTIDRVFIAEWVAYELKEMAEAARPLETGGVLVGVLRDDEPWVTSAVQVVDETRTSASFEIPTGVTPIAVEAARTDDRRVGFIGFWHSHPANAPASPTDKRTLGREARRRSRPKKVPAVMIVVRDSGPVWCLDVLRDRGSGPAVAEVILTGPLGPEQADDAG
jgi:hypothetical protein